MRQFQTGAASGVSTGLFIISMWLGMAAYLRFSFLSVSYEHDSSKVVPLLNGPYPHERIGEIVDQFWSYDAYWFLFLFVSLPLLAFAGGATQFMGNASSGYGIVHGINLISGVEARCERVRRRLGLAGLLAIPIAFAILPLLLFTACAVTSLSFLPLARILITTAPEGQARGFAIVAGLLHLAAYLVIPFVGMAVVGCRRPSQDASLQM